MTEAPPTLRVFRLEPSVWWVGPSLDDCVNKAREKDPDAAPYPENFAELAPADLESLVYVDEKGPRTFAARLEEVKAAGEREPREFYRGPSAGGVV